MDEVLHRRAVFRCLRVHCFGGVTSLQILADLRGTRAGKLGDAWGSFRSARSASNSVNPVALPAVEEHLSGGEATQSSKLVVSEALQGAVAEKGGEDDALIAHERLKAELKRTLAKQKELEAEVGQLRQHYTRCTLEPSGGLSSLFPPSSQDVL